MYLLPYNQEEMKTISLLVIRVIVITLLLLILFLLFLLVGVSCVLLRLARMR